MRILCGLGLAILISGSLAAEHHGDRAPTHSGAASNGARPSVPRSSSRFQRAPSMIMAPYAYPADYDYSAPPADQSYTDSSEAVAGAAADDSSPAPRSARASEPPVHSLILDMEDMDATPPAEPVHYYIALKDCHVYLAVAYWVQGDTLHYFLPGNTHNQVSLSLVDRDLTRRLNRESGTEVRLPGK
ncbi:MAG: hypothetical protein WBL61_06545 [Bryobacteraceae bacterium]